LLRKDEREKRGGRKENNEHGVKSAVMRVSCNAKHSVFTRYSAVAVLVENELG